MEEEEENPEEETDKIITMGKFKKPTNRAHILDLESDSSEDETDDPPEGLARHDRYT